MKGRGFTLLELMLALAVFAILAGLAAQVLDSVLTTEKKLRHSASELRQLQLTMSLVEQDLLHFSLTNYPRQSLNAPLLARHHRLSFTTGVNELPFDRRGVIQRVTYRLDHGNFIRELQSNPETPAQQRVLLRHVEALKFEYLSINNHWLTELNPRPIRMSDTLTLRYLPKLVNLSLRTKAWGKLEFILILGPRVSTL